MQLFACDSSIHDNVGHGQVTVLLSHMHAHKVYTHYYIQTAVVCTHVRTIGSMRGIYMIDLRRSRDSHVTFPTVFTASIVRFDTLHFYELLL